MGVLKIRLCWQMPLPVTHSVSCFISLQEEPFSLCKSLAGEPNTIERPGSSSPVGALSLAAHDGTVISTSMAGKVGPFLLHKYKY